MIAAGGKYQNPFAEPRPDAGIVQCFRKNISDEGIEYRFVRQIGVIAVPENILLLPDVIVATKRGKDQIDLPFMKRIETDERVLFVEAFSV